MENILDNAIDSTATLPETSKSQSLKLSLERLDGGFISDISGKRKIYPDVGDIIDALDMHKTINKLDHAEYRLHINIIHKDEFDDMLALKKTIAGEAVDQMSIEDAKKRGIIQEADKFDPNKPACVVDTNTPIKIDIRNAYSIARLKSLPWKEWDEQLSMSNGERADIAGLKKNSFYTTWNNAISGKAQYQRPEVRVGMTILAQYFERMLDVRTSAKDQCEKMKEDMLKTIREIELITNGKSHVKVSDVLTKLGAMRTTLLG